MFLIAPVSTFCLGVWQYRRRQWKIDTIAALDEKVRRAEAVDLEVEDYIGVEYQRVKTRGTFDNSAEILIGPRSFIDSSGGSGAGGIISFSRPGDGEKVGYHVVTAFTLASTGQRVLVNRGWVPQSRGNMTTRMGGQVSGQTEVSGVLRLAEETSSLVPANDEKSSRWHSRDLAALARKLDTLPLIMDLDLASSNQAASQGGPVGGQTRIALRNDHVQYMMTWWGVSLITGILWLQKFVF